MFAPADYFHRNQHDTIREREGNSAHLFGRFHTRVEKGRQVLCPDGTVHYVKSALSPHRMCADARRAKLGNDKLLVRDYLAQSDALDATDQFFGSERPFARGTPDVDAFCVEHEYPPAAAGQCAPQAVEAHLVIGRNEDWRIGGWITHRIKSGLDRVSHPSDGPAHLPTAEPVGPVQFCGHSWNLSPVVCYE